MKRRMGGISYAAATVSGHMGCDFQRPAMALIRRYGLGSTDVRRLSGRHGRPVWKIVTPARGYVLKSLDQSLETAVFIVHCVRHLTARRVATPRLWATLDGEEAPVVGGRPHLLFSYVEGSAPRYDRPRDLWRWMHALAAFHRGSEGAPVERAPARRRLAGSWETALGEKLGQVAAWCDEHPATGQPLDELVRRAADRILAQGEVALERLAAAREPYSKWLACHARRPTLCHQDFSPSNLARRAGGFVAFDVDGLAADIEARDLSKVLHKILQHTPGWWYAALARRLVDEYATVRPLSAGQRRVLAAYVSFPHLAHGLVSRYFSRGRPQEPRWLDKLTRRLRFEASKARSYDLLRKDNAT